MSQHERATLTDWPWVQMMIMQAMVGVVIPELTMVLLTEEPEEWVVTFYFCGRISDDAQQDFVEIGGDAEAYLSQGPRIGPVHTTSAIRRPVRSVLKFEEPPRLSSRIHQNDRHRVLFCLNPSLIWRE